MKQTIRHKQIIKLVKEQGYLSTEELVNLLGVSPQTMRRDLNELAENNLIIRYHGGAAAISRSINSDYNERKEFFSVEKGKLAQHVAKLIPNGASLFIDIGTTPEAIAYALLEHKDLCIVTNNINAAHILMKNKTFQITIASGALRQDGGVIGESTISFISQFRLDYGILGISAIDLDGSLLDFDYHEVQVKRAIIENSQTTILAVDHSKFSRKAMVRLGSLSEIEHLLTNKKPPEAIIELMKKNNLSLELCNN